MKGGWEFCVYGVEISPNLRVCLIFCGVILVDLDFEEESENIVPTQMNLNILYEDNAYIVINKPANMPVHPSRAHYEDTLSNGIKYYFNQNKIYKKIRPVNRLDRDTSRNCYICQK